VESEQAHTFAELSHGSFHPSLLSSEWVGAKCLLAAVLHHLGKSDTARQHALEAIARLEKGCKQFTATWDVMHGRAGALLVVFVSPSRTWRHVIGKRLCSSNVKIHIDGRNTAGASQEVRSAIGVGISK
jgi:hypothetical protein